MPRAVHQSSHPRGPPGLFPHRGGGESLYFAEIGRFVSKTEPGMSFVYQHNLVWNFEFFWGPLLAPSGARCLKCARRILKRTPSGCGVRQSSGSSSSGRKCPRRRLRLSLASLSAGRRTRAIGQGRRFDQRHCSLFCRLHARVWARRLVNRWRT